MPPDPLLLCQCPNPSLTHISAPTQKQQISPENWATSAGGADLTTLWLFLTWEGRGSPKGARVSPWLAWVVQQATSEPAPIHTPPFPRTPRQEASCPCPANS